MDWAATQNNLGLVLWRLGEHEGDIENLQKAITAYEKAFKENTRERGPLVWAKTQYITGVTLRSVARITSNKEYLRKAVVYFTSALEVFTPEHSPYYHDISTKMLNETLAELNGT